MVAIFKVNPVRYRAKMLNRPTLLSTGFTDASSMSPLSECVAFTFATGQRKFGKLITLRKNNYCPYRGSSII